MQSPRHSTAGRLLRALACTCMALALAACPKPLQGRRADAGTGTGAGNGSSAGNHPTADPGRDLVRSDEVEVTVIQTRDRRAGESFSEAVTLYESGHWQRAADAFAVFGAEYPDDPLAYRAELYRGRSLAADGRLDAADSVFRSAADSVDADESVAGNLYRAFVATHHGDHAAAVQVLTQMLARNPAARVRAGYVVGGDEALLASMLARGRVASGAYADALVDAETAWVWAADDELRQWAWAQATTIAREHLSAQELFAEIQSASDFRRAVVAGEVIERYLRDGDRASAAAAADLAGPSLVMLGHSGDYAAYRRALQEVSGRPAWGALLSLSGADRRAGRAALGGVLLAQRAFEEAEARSTVFIEDTAGSAATTRDAVSRLHGRGVRAFVGPIEPDLAAAAATAAAELGMTMLSLAVAPHEGLGDAALRLSYDAGAEAEAVIAHAATRRRATRYFIVREEPAAAYLERFADAASSAIRGSGGVVVGERVIDTDDTQGSAERTARAIVASDADAIVVACTGTTTAAIAAWVARSDVWPADGPLSVGASPRRIHWLGNSFVYTETLAVNSADYVEGLVVPVWFDRELHGEPAQRFADRFAYTYQREPGALEAIAFSAASLLRDLTLGGATNDPQTLQLALSPANEFSSTSGRFRFLATGESTLMPAIGVLRGQSLVRP